MWNGKQVGQGRNKKKYRQAISYKHKSEEMWGFFQGYDTAYKDWSMMQDC